MDIVAQSLVSIVLILGILVLVATVAFALVLRMLVKQSKSLVQLIVGDRKRDSDKDNPALTSVK